MPSHVPVIVPFAAIRPSMRCLYTSDKPQQPLGPGVLTDLAIHHVCGLDELRDAPLFSASRIVSILDVNEPPPPELYAVTAPVLTLRFDDIVKAADRSAPTRAHVKALLEFDEAAHRDERLVVHCTAGISRSTAALAVLLAARHPELEDEIFVAVRQLRPRAWPNSLVVSLGAAARGRP